jgi:phosphohistidine phosphatase
MTDIARTLVLLRHAKAEPPTGHADEQRPLSARGHSDALAAGAWLAGRLAPDLVLCSPSRRTRQTWEGVAAAMREVGVSGSPEVRYEPLLYDGGAEDLLAAVREVGDGVSVVLVIGHNPTLSQLAFTLDPAARLDPGGLRTCGLTVHRIVGAWQDCAPGGGPMTVTHTARGQ